MLDSITVRRMPFEFDEDIDPVIVPGDPQQSFAMVAGSLLLPHLEPYLIRSMKAAEQEIDDPTLLEDLKRFCAQEGQHYRMHRKWNATVRRAGFSGLAKLEEELAQDYERFSRTKSLRWNLAYAEGFEAFTFAPAAVRGEETHETANDVPAHAEVFDVVITVGIASA